MLTHIFFICAHFKAAITTGHLNVAEYTLPWLQKLFAAAAHTHQQSQNEYGRVTDMSFIIIKHS